MQFKQIATSRALATANLKFWFAIQQIVSMKLAVANAKRWLKWLEKCFLSRKYCVQTFLGLKVRKLRFRRLFLSDGNVLIVTRTISLERYWGKENPYGLKAKIEKSIWFAFALMKSAK